ncbi:uncharacterized protein PV09_03943 [Verruconis gallopava]|uniref:NmrA-like domain-containing protein n=1 Tax=Verruconis gallopava TaxID=253628 RepID=A0A0D2AEM1_9PEZI|nr:uncharacterized protein PV09_03943 [Verruconis gallopava]KIW05433.1 hypothetical protein PV09_03943 [Verruconis gallopava]
MAIKNVALLGADGKLGPSVLKELFSNGFSVTILKRQSSKSPSNYPSSVKEVKVPDEFTVDSLVPILEGQDAVVITTSGSLVDLQKRVALASAKAGVQRLIPADFGSVDSESLLARELVPLYVHKRNLRLYLDELTKLYPKFSWTALVCGHFFDWSLEFMHIWKKERVIDILDDGNVKASASSLAQVARATARILQNIDLNDTANRILYVQSFCKTQIEVKEALERVTGESWSVRSFNRDEFLKDKMSAMKSGENAIEDVVWWLGVIEANWENRNGFAMDLLGLEEEDLDSVIRIAVAT